MLASPVLLAQAVTSAPTVPENCCKSQTATATPAEPGELPWVLADAERMAAALTPLTSRLELVLLRLSNYDNLDASVTFKDERRSRH